MIKLARLDLPINPAKENLLVFSIQDGFIANIIAKTFVITEVVSLCILYHHITYNSVVITFTIWDNLVTNLWYILNSRSDRIVVILVIEFDPLDNIFNTSGRS